MIFPKWAFPELRDLPEGKGGSVLIKKYPGRVRTVDAQGLYELKDADSPEDLKELAEFFFIITPKPKYRPQKGRYFLFL